jgi:hypothetical protein
MLTVTGNFESITGASLGRVAVQLQGYTGIARVPGTGVIVNPTLMSLVSGSFSIVLFGNDAITPSGTWYLFSFYDSVGNLLAQCKYILTGSGTVDISTLTPSS